MNHRVYIKHSIIVNYQGQIPEIQIAQPYYTVNKQIKNPRQKGWELSPPKSACDINLLSAVMTHSASC